MKTERLLIIALYGRIFYLTGWRLAQDIILFVLLRITVMYIYVKYIHTIHFSKVGARQMYHIRTRQFSFMSNQSNIHKDGVLFKDWLNGLSGCY